MDYKNKHEEEITRATQLWECGDITRENLEYIFPELCESDDEKNIKDLIDELKCSLKAANCQNDACGGGHEKRISLLEWAIAWLERQENKKSFGLNEEEKIKNVIRGWIYTQPASFFDNGISKEEILAWLEKQSEQKFIIDGILTATNYDKMFQNCNVHKFNVGDWIINKFHDICLITDIDLENGYYICESNRFGNTDGDIDLTDKAFHLWTIQDAKDGDVLAYMTDEEDLWIMIYWSLYEPYEGHVHYHALLVNDNFSDKGTCCICINNLKPATKEQRELLFKKMKEAGYEFNFEEKKLDKIENQCEQKTKWNEDDKIRLDRICKTLWKNRKGDTDEIYQQEQDIDWLKSLISGK